MILFTVSLLLSSCGIYTKYERPKDINFAGADNTTKEVLDSTSLVPPSWREIFTDPYLQELLEKGLRNNTDLKIAQLRVEEAKATLLSAKLTYLPSFAFAPQGTVSSFDKSKASYVYNLPLEANWEIDIFGRIRNSKRQAKALLEQSSAYSQAVQTQLIANIANAYYTLLMLDAQLDISQQTADSWKETVKTIRFLMNAGIANKTAVDQMEGTYYSICTSVLDLKEQITQIENSLSLLLAEPLSDIKRGKLNDYDTSRELFTHIPVGYLSNRPDVREAEYALKAAFYGTNQARAAFYPSLTLNGSAGWSNAVGDVIINPSRFLVSAIASLVQPLFNKGENIAKLKIAKAQQEEAKLAFQQVLLSAGCEVNDALTKYQTAKEKSSLYEKQIHSLYKACEGTSLLMRYGNTSYLEVLTARQSLLDAKLTQVANHFAEIQSIINLYHALGGGV